MISIVIPNFNGKHLLEKNLPLILDELGDTDEVVIVDDASTDDSIAWLRKTYPKIIVVAHQKNLQFAQSVNDGIARANNEFCLLLNSDVYPVNNAIVKLKKDISQLFSEKVATVGLLEHQKNGDFGRSTARFERGMYQHSASRPNSGVTAWASGGSMILRKSLWVEIGGFDRLFRPAYWEDIDFSYRALAMGYEVLFRSEYEVYHDHESTNATVYGNWKIQLYSFKNSLLFFWKNVCHTSISLWISHILWLPYHIFIGGLRTRGAFFAGFFLALAQLPEVIRARSFQSKCVLHDDEVIRKIQNDNA